MGYVEGTSREQASIWSLEEMVAEESMVRIIDRYIDRCDLAKLGFTRTQPAETGRPAYPPDALAKLYVYGYENCIRSSRKLERETRRNVEAMWLTGNLTPDHKTIAEFRRQNVRPLQKLFREFVKLCRSWELVGGNLFVEDGTKIKASNNKKNNFSMKKIKDRLARIEKKIGDARLDEKIDAYMAELEEADRREEMSAKAPDGLKELLERKELYEEYLAGLEKSGENELSTVDRDARLMGNNRGGVDVSYNVIGMVDGKRHLIVDFDVLLNPSDQGSLAPMAKRLIRMGYRKFYLLADKGFYNGEDLLKVRKYKIKAIVARQKPSDPKGQPEEFHSDKFEYDSKSDTYRCPAGETLDAHSKKGAARRNFFNKTACAGCPHVSVCAVGQRGYRAVTRNQYSEVYEAADRLFDENKNLYKLRQQIVEHTFGTIKHTMNGGYFLLRTRRKVRCETALLCLGYNLKRAYSALGFRKLMAKLDSLPRRFSRILSFRGVWSGFNGYRQNLARIFCANRPHHRRLNAVM